MLTFHASSGTIIPSGRALGILVKSIQADVIDASVTDVGITMSGSLTTGPYRVNGITPVVNDYRFLPGEHVYVEASGSYDAVIINYIEVGDAKAYRRTENAQASTSGAIGADYWQTETTALQKWPDVVQSGSYRTTY